MKELTIIIPFRNEGGQVLKTCESFNRHCDPSLFDLLCINDRSDDGYDYSEVARLGNVRLVDNPGRLGVAGSRDKGVKMCGTKYVLLVDGHMRVFGDVVAPLLEKLRQNPRSLLCCQSKAIRYNATKGVYEVEKKPRTRGVRLNAGVGHDFLNYKWDTLTEADALSDTVPIQCCMGACYAIGREYYLYLHGLNGLQQWGMDEQFLSAKVWMSGGRVLLLKNIEIAHVYRGGTPIPYGSMEGVKVLNLLIVTYLLADEKTFNDLKGFLSSGIYARRTQEIVDIFGDLYPFLVKERTYLNLIMKHPFQHFLAYGRP